MAATHDRAARHVRARDRTGSAAAPPPLATLPRWEPTVAVASASDAPPTGAAVMQPPLGRHVARSPSLSDSDYTSAYDDDSD